MIWPRNFPSLISPFFWLEMLKFMNNSGSIKLSLGMSILEGSLILLVLIPFILGVVGLVDYVQISNDLDRLTEKYANDSGLKPFVLGTFSSDQAIRSRNSFPLKQTTTDFQSYLKTMVDSLAQDLADTVGCELSQTECLDRFFVEIRFIELEIDVFSGEALRVRHLGDYKITDPNHPVGQNELYFIAVGDLMAQSNSLKRDLLCYVAPQLKDNPHPFTLNSCPAPQVAKASPVFSHAIPSSLTGVSVQQSYGNSAAQALAGVSDRPNQFLRSAMLVGAQVLLDISGTAAGYFSSTFSVAENNHLRSFSISAPRQIY